MQQPLCRGAQPAYWVLGFGRINADETHTLIIFHHQCIAIDYTLHNTVITANTSNAVANATAGQVESDGEE
jgi:hypothetical protein